MGLDANFYAVGLQKIDDAQLTCRADLFGVEPEDLEYLCYWRRHHPLHEWMGRLFVEKGGDPNAKFNQYYVRLIAQDLDKLEHDLRSGKIEDVQMLYNNASTLGFCIPAARQAIAAGKAVFYWGYY